MVVAVVLVGVVALLLGASVGWLERGRRCRRDHGALLATTEPAAFETLLDEPPRIPAPRVPAETDVQADPVPGQYAGSARPGPDGRAPHPAYVVKVKLRSRIYHTPASPSYDQTKAELWFRTPAEAEAAGFRAPRARSAARARD